MIYHLETVRKDDDLRFGSAMYQLYPPPRDNIYQRATYVSYIRTQSTVFKINSLIVSIDSQCRLNFVPAQGSFGASNPTKHPFRNFTLPGVGIFIYPNDNPRVPFQRRSAICSVVQAKERDTYACSNPFGNVPG
jgi:hypothetical protein